VLVTGPTGSGKTTTLYSALAELNTIGTNISTAEDPVEFNLAGINQAQMHEDIGYNFAAALRAFLRQDPDIIMVGEIRDLETADTAIQAAISLLRLEIDRRLIRKEGSDTYNAFCQVVDQWDGTGERPSLCANGN
jgi:nucleoside-triphosphatase THEP1